jgi:hypothetical protein
MSIIFNRKYYIKMEINKLDNPAWYSLSETHKDFVIDYKNQRAQIQKLLPIWELPQKS